MRVTQRHDSVSPGWQSTQTLTLTNPEVRDLFLIDAVSTEKGKPIPPPRVTSQDQDMARAGQSPVCTT